MVLITKKVDTLTDLGWANDWRETPEIVKRCRQAQHGKTGAAREDRTGWSCVTAYSCDICNYKYQVDSSG